MIIDDPDFVFDSARLARLREAFPTALSTEQLRELGAGFLARSVFTAQGINAIFAQKLGEIIVELTQGNIGEGQAKTAIWEVLKAVGYTPEGGFPDDLSGEVPPAVRGSLQDLSSFRRRDLIVRTQLALMEGAGEQYRGHLPEYLAEYPAWELIRVGEVEVARDWPARWTIAGGQPPQDDGIIPGSYKYLGEPTGMIALKGDPVWGELGSYENFPDALGVDHPPWYFNSEMGWREVSRKECLELGITGPNGESIDEYHSGMERPRVMAGSLPLPTPQISLRGMDRATVTWLKEETRGEEKGGTLFYNDLLEKELAKAAEAYQKRNPDYDPDYKKGGDR